MGFRHYHSIDLSGWHGDAGAAEIDAIVRGVAAVPGRGSPSPALPPVAPAARPRTVSRRRLLLGACAAAAAGVAGFVAWRKWPQLGFLSASGNSVAVLPFENVSGDPEQDYFADGPVRGTARDAGPQPQAAGHGTGVVGEVPRRKDDAMTIAEQLGVAYLLDGSVRRSGDVVRITADLIDGGSGFSRWSQTFERRMQRHLRRAERDRTTVASALAARVASDAGTQRQRGGPGRRRAARRAWRRSTPTCAAGRCTT